MAEKTQNYANHRRFLPVFHFFVLPVILLNVFVELRRAYYTQWSRGSIWNLVVAVALLALGLAARMMAVSVQDRVIRAEERARLAEKLPSDLRGRIGELTPNQLVALRFSSDEELADLTRRCLSGEFKSQNAIKKAVRNWRPDYLRA
jgi:hypothetical protein